VILSASRPLSAAQVLLAITATPPSGANDTGGGVPSIFTTLTTPGTFIVALVVRSDLALRHGRPADDGEQHAGQFYVLAISRLAGRDIEQVDDGDAVLADVAERARLLELQRVERGRRQSRRIDREFAIAELLARRGVHDFVEARLHFACVHAPASAPSAIPAFASRWNASWANEMLPFLSKSRPRCMRDATSSGSIGFTATPVT
jgi:hypothetical protein